LIVLPSIPDDVYIEDLLKKEVKKAIKSLYLEVLSQKEYVQNSGNALELAIISGKISYQDGVFVGEFNKTTSKILKDLGAKWTKKGWKLDADKLDAYYLSAIVQAKAIDSKKVERLLNNLMGVDVKRIASKADVERIYQKAVENINKKLDDGLRQVPTVRAQFSEEQLDGIKKEYTENMKLHIKGWAQDEIDTLRVKVNENVRKGIRYEELAKYIEKRYEATPQKALFIARQETRLLSTEMKKQKYEKAGITEFKWIARKDDKVREDHAELDGQIFRFDDPPIIDSRTGKRGLPGQSFNCRCAMRPIIGSSIS